MDYMQDYGEVKGQSYAWMKEPQLLDKPLTKPEIEHKSSRNQENHGYV
jgi:hypothetical protein